MVFSSVPVYLDPPNWQQQTNQPQEGSFHENNQLPPLPPSAAAHHVSGSGGSIRPHSMAERARLAKLPQPEGPLNCPRCESTNTKFCYYNNYSLSQPRHFCKTCRRYWTKGGALRNVPVGGGCRRNKKSKSSSSRSSSSSVSAAAERQTGSNSTSGISSSAELLGHLPQPSQFPFVPSLQNFSRFGLGNIGLNNITTLNLSGLPGHIETINSPNGQGDIGFGIGNESGRSNLALSTGGIDQWRGSQIPWLGGFEAPIGLYNSFQSEGVEASSSSMVGFSQLRSMTSNSGITQLASVKVEGNRDPNLSRTPLSIAENNQFWGNNSWTDLAGPNTSSNSASHLS